jgi:large subunit ribosomal protein L35
MKQKTIKSASKRIKISGGGKILRRKMTAQHLASGKSKRTRRASGKFVNVSSADTKKMRRMINA